MDEGTPVQAKGRGNQEVAARLLRSLRGGSSQAWAALYDQLAPGLRRFAASCLSADAETADDIVVETLAHAARGIARFDPGRSSLAAWIYGIARRQVEAERRRRKRHKSVPAWAQVSLEDLAELSESEDLGARTAARVDAQRRLREAADLLSESEVELLTLSGIEEVPVHEIAQVVGRSQQATKMLLHRARQKVRRSEIEGTLLAQGMAPTARRRGPHVIAPYSHWFNGARDWRGGDETGLAPALSPVSDDVVYYAEGPEVSVCIWRAKRDGSEATNLTAQIGLGGINKYPKWSPDGSLIAFIHWEGPPGEVGGPGEAWVLKADGSEARRVASRARMPATEPAWSADGSTLFCKTGDVLWRPRPAPVWRPSAALLDLWGREVRVAEAGGTVDCSPDGSRVAMTHRVRGKLEGEPGHWTQLVVTRRDGSRPRVLFERFAADAEVEMQALWHRAPEEAPDWDWRGAVLYFLGPAEPTWSPAGDKLAFLAALPFDPRREFGDHVQAWIYDLVARRLTKVTDEPTVHHSLSWR